MSLAVTKKQFLLTLDWRSPLRLQRGTLGSFFCRPLYMLDRTRERLFSAASMCVYIYKRTFLAAAFNRPILGGINIYYAVGRPRTPIVCCAIVLLPLDEEAKDTRHSSTINALYGSASSIDQPR